MVSAAGSKATVPRYVLDHLCPRPLLTSCDQYRLAFVTINLIEARRSKKPTVTVGTMFTTCFVTGRAANSVRMLCRLSRNVHDWTAIASTLPSL